MLRMQWGLMDVHPEGESGEKYILTAHCVATRYAFLRQTWEKTATAMAETMLDVILDAGVVSRVWRSDLEFETNVLGELTNLLGGSQIFSATLRPQAQRITERSDRSIRRAPAVYVQTLARSCPRRWPLLLRMAESKLRHTVCPNGYTPYAALHGFSGTAQLETALRAVQEIPVDMVHDEWLRSIVREAQSLEKEMFLEHEEGAGARARRRAEATGSTHFRAGDLVLVQKPFLRAGRSSHSPSSRRAVLDTCCSGRSRISLG